MSKTIFTIEDLANKKQFEDVFPHLLKQISCVSCGKLYLKNQFSYACNGESQIINQDNKESDQNIEDGDLIDLSEKNIKKQNINPVNVLNEKLPKGKNLICSVCIEDVKQFSSETISQEKEQLIMEILNPLNVKCRLCDNPSIKFLDIQQHQCMCQKCDCPLNSLDFSQNQNQVQTTHDCVASLKLKFKNLSLAHEQSLVEKDSSQFSQLQNEKQKLELKVLILQEQLENEKKINKLNSESLDNQLKIINSFQINFFNQSAPMQDSKSQIHDLKSNKKEIKNFQEILNKINQLVFSQLLNQVNQQLNFNEFINKTFLKYSELQNKFPLAFHSINFNCIKEHSTYIQKTGDLQFNQVVSIDKSIFGFINQQFDYGIFYFSKENKIYQGNVKVIFKNQNLIQNDSKELIEDIIKDGMGWQIIVPKIQNLEKNEFQDGVGNLYYGPFKNGQYDSFKNENEINKQDLMFIQAKPSFYIWLSSNETYFGTFKEGNQHGFGCLYKFIGDNDQISEKYQSRMISYFNEGSRVGLGMHERNGLDFYVGEYFEDRSHGSGIYCLWEQQDMNQVQEKYTGEWKSGSYNGYGVVERKGKSKYFGKFKNDQICDNDIINNEFQP